ncbi:hypothetical protein [Streptomyces sp. NPDC002962]|uniref:hypothetical protein n=1 Tax=Streptomyces sp. NPDC002962 TaxID=3364674 RepID=UPI00369DA52E
MPALRRYGIAGSVRLRRSVIRPRQRERGSEEIPLSGPVGERLTRGESAVVGAEQSLEIPIARHIRPREMITSGLQSMSVDTPGEENLLVYGGN